MAVELVHDLMAEQPACPAAAVGPGVDFLRVGPHQVRERSLSGDLHFPIDLPDLIQRVYVRRQSSMDTKYFIYLYSTKVPLMIAPSGK